MVISLRTLAIWTTITAAFLSIEYASPAMADLANADLWKAHALYCEAEPGKKSSKLTTDCSQQSAHDGKTTNQTKLCFPTKGREDHDQACDDGDMTLFNGLLCSSGNQHGCSAVADSQDISSGEWFRSPRLRYIVNSNRINSFSPDMAIGIYHWLAENPNNVNRDQFSLWLSWLAKNKRCLDDNCSRTWPRFCSDDDKEHQDAQYGCTMRPSDLAVLGTLVKQLDIKIDDTQIRELSSEWAEYSNTLIWISANTDELGYPLHLAGAVINLYEKLGINDPALDDAKMALIRRQPKNPYFALVAGNLRLAESLTLSLCPTSEAGIPLPHQRFQWSWEREDSEEAWKYSMLWDCIFMSDILQ